MTEFADCFLAIPGGIGTFEEFFAALCADMTGDTAKPIIIFNINDCYSPLLILLTESVNSGFSSKICYDYIYECTSCAEVLSALEIISLSKYKKRNITGYHDE